MNNNPDIRLDVGLEAGSSDKFKKELKDLIESCIAEPAKIKIELDKNSFEKVKNQISSLQKQIKNINGTINLTDNSKDTEKKTSEFKKYFDIVQSINKTNVKMAKLGSDTETYKVLERQLVELKNKKDQLDQAMQSSGKSFSASELNQINEAYQKTALAIDEIIAKQKDAKAAADKANAAMTVGTKDYSDSLSKVNRKIEQTESNLEKWTSAKNGKSSSAYTGLQDSLDELKALQNELLNQKISKNDFDIGFKRISANITGYNTEIKAAGENTKSFMSRIAGLSEKFVQWFNVSQIVMYSVRTIKQMISNVKELDTAMTELKKVTDETNSTYTKFLESASSRAKVLGATISDTVTATADYARLGYSLDDASKLADTSIIYKNVGDGIESITDASESIISTMKAFGIEATDSMSIVDKFNIVGNNFAISSKGVGDALLNSASSLATANNTLEESIALITAGNNVIQNPEKVGTAIKTISMYLRAATTEAEEAGESTDGMAKSVSELRSELLQLTGGKVDIQIDENTFKSTYQIMKDLSEVWGELTDLTRANIIEKIGGKRNANVVTAILGNFNTAEEVVETALNSSGSAIAENEKYLNSIEGKTAQFKATFEELSMAIIDSDLVKFVIDSGSAILDVISKLNKGIGSLIPAATTITGLVTAFKSLKGVSAGFFSTTGSGADAEYTFNGKSFSEIKNDFITSQKNGDKLSTSIISGISNNKVDISDAAAILDLYNDAIKGTAEDMEAFNEILSKAPKGVRNYINDLHGAPAAMEGLMDCYKKTGESITFLGESAKSSSLKVGLLNAALNVGISLAISVIISLISKAINAANELHDKIGSIVSDYDSQQENIRNVGSSIDELSGKYESLSKGVNTFTNENKNLSTSEYKEYLTVVNDIADTFPELIRGYDEQGNAILTLDGNVKGLTDSYRALQETANNAVLTTAHDIFKDFKNQKNKINNPNTGLDALFNAGMSYDSFEKLEMILNSKDIDDAVEKLLGDVDSAASVQIARELRNAGLTQDFSKSNFDFIKRAVKENRTIVRSIVSDYNSQVDAATGGMKSLARAFASASMMDDKEITSEYKGIINSAIENLDFDFYKDLKNEDELRSKIAEMIDSLKGLTDDQQAIIEVAFDAKTKFNNGDISVSDYLKQIGKISELEAVLPEEVYSTIKMTLDDGDLQEKIKEMTGGQSKDVAAWMNGLSGTDFELAYKIWVNDTDAKYTLDEWKAKLKKEQAIAFELDISDVTDKLKRLHDAMSESMSGTGATEESIKNIRNLFGDMASYDPEKVFEKTALGVRINTKAVKELELAYEKENKTALNNKLKELESQYLDLTTQINNCTDANNEERNSLEIKRQEILDNIQATNIQIAQYEALTSAYSQWQAAKSGEKDQNIYEEIIQGRKDVDDLLSRGWVDEEVKSFVNLISKEDLATASAEEVLAAYKKLNKTVYKSGFSVWDFFTTDKDGNSTSKGVYNFFDTVRKELGKTYAWIDDNGNYNFDFSANGMTNEKIAEKLGINVEAVQAILKAAIGAGFEIDFESISGDMESVLTQAESYVEKLKKITKSNDLSFNFVTTDQKSLTNQIESAQELLDSFRKNGKLDINTDGVKEAQFVLQTLVAEKIALEKPAVLSVDVNKVDKEMQDTFKKVGKFWDAYSVYEQQIKVAVDDKSKKEAQSKIIEYIEQMNGLFKLGIELSANPNNEEIETALNKIKEYIGDKEFAAKFGLNQEDIDASTAKIKESVQTVIDNIPPIKITFDLSQAGKLGEWIKKIFGDGITIGVGVDDENAKDELNGIKEQKDDVNQDCSFSIDAETKKANKSLSGIQSLVKNLSYGTTVKIGADTSGAQTKITNLSTSLSNLTNKTYTTNVTYNVSSKSSSGGNSSGGWVQPNLSGGKPAYNGTAWINGTAFIQGNWGTKESGIALGGELGQELIVRDGRFFTIGDDSAEFFNYKKGDIIFNAEQTKQIFKNGKIRYGAKRARALAEGTAFGGGSNGSGLNYNAVTNSSGGSSGKSSSKSSSNSSKSSSKTNNSSKAADDAKEKIDYIEIAISRLERAIQNLGRTATSTYKTLSQRLTAATNEISKVNSEISLQQKAYDKYISEANKVSLSSDIKAKVRDGSIDIKEYSSDTADLIKEYQDLYEKALDCQDAIADLKETAASLYEDKFNDTLDNYENQLSLLEHKTNTYETGIDMLEAKGYLASAKYYKALQDVEKQNVEVLNSELSSLKSSLQTALDSGTIKEGSAAWYEMQGSIYGVEEAIGEASLAIAEYNNNMREVEWERFEYLQDEISQLTKEADFLIDLMDSSELFDKNGSITDKGTATLGLHAMNYDVYMAQADKYDAEIAKINKELARDENKNNTILIEKREELLGLQQDSILAAEDEKQAISDLVKDGIDLQLSAMKELIDNYTEALDNAKDLYDYQKKINDSTSKIASLEKQLSAYQNDTSEETKAKIQKLKVELTDAKDELEETEYEHYISEQKKLLDQMYTEYETMLNQRLDDIDLLLSDIIGATNDNASSISETLNTVSSDVGYTLSEEFQNVWGTSGIQGTLSTYGDNFNEKLTSINTVLNSISTTVATMAGISDKKAEETINKPDAPVTKTPAQPKPATTTPTKTTTPKTTTKAITVGGKINAGSAKIYTSCYGEGGTTQYFKKDPIYTVIKEQNGYLLVRHHTQSKGNTGWFKKSDVKAYKQGGAVDYTGFAWLDGTPQKPETVLDAEDSANLIRLTEILKKFNNNSGVDSGYELSTPSVMSDVADSYKQIAAIVGERFGSEGYGNVTIDIDIDHVDNYNDFMQQLTKDNQFVKFVESFTINRMIGGNSLSKNKYKW